MADKPLQIISGVITQVEGKQSSAGAGDAGKIPALDAAGRLDSSMMPVGFAVDSKSITASENLAAGNLVNVWDDSGTVKVRKADATTAGKEANGYVLAGVSSGAAATVYFEQLITGLTSLTLGATYYLHTTAGGISTTAPCRSGNVVQRIGRAISATELLFQPSAPITLA
jgi:hypothetical protein